MRLVHSKSPVSVDNECATVSLMKSYSACDHACPALADGNVELMCTFIYNFYDLNDLELTLGNLWELAPPQRVDSTGGAMPGLTVADYTLHVYSQRELFVDPGLERSHPVFDGLLDSHPLPCQISSPASKPHPESPSGLAYTLEWRDACTRGACTLIEANRSDAASIDTTPHLCALLTRLAASLSMAPALPIPAIFTGLHEPSCLNA